MDKSFGKLKLKMQVSTNYSKSLILRKSCVYTAVSVCLSHCAPIGGSANIMTTVKECCLLI